MLLVTFHGGSSGVTNVYAYDTSDGTLNTPTALQKASLSKAELRGMVYANSYLYVVNGGKSASDILCFQPPASGSKTWNFDYVDEFVGPSLSKKGHFENAIGHPYAIQFDGAGLCYVSNQDTNVVAQAPVASDFKTAKIPKGCQSQYLNSLTSICPKTGCLYLDGTFVASQVGTLPDVEVDATPVPSQYGGLSVNPPTNITKVQNSVRDLAISNGVLLVCDEPSDLVRLYSLSNGNYLGASPALKKGPTHLAIFGNGLYVSAGDQLYWSALSNPPTPQGLSFQSVLAAPAAINPYSVGGVTFDSSSNTAYVVFQQGKGETGSGAIYSYNVTNTGSSTPPVFGNPTVFATICSDTPEFVLFLPNP
jgi:hypothetical protein